MKKMIDTKTILLHLMKYRERTRVEISDILAFYEYLWEDLQQKGILDQYHIAFDISNYSLERTANYNCDILGASIDIKEVQAHDAYIYLIPNKNIEEIALRYPIDDNIKNSFEKYCYEDEKEFDSDIKKEVKVLKNVKVST